MLVKPLPNESGVLAALTPAVYARLTPNLKIVRLEAGSTLFDIDSISDQILTPIRYWLAHRRKRGGCVPRNPSNRKERSDGAGSFLRLGQSSRIEEVLEDFAKIAAAKGIRLFSVRFKRDRLERELKSFAPQSSQRINLRRSARGQVAGQQRNPSQKESDRRKRHWVCRLHAE